MDIFVQLIKLLVFDAIVVAIVLGALVPLSRLKCATFAVLKRNFVGYFSNPTGYVFICVFVFLSSVAAFWSQEFFARNLATLDQLNFWFTFIMLAFVPAITMSIWAQERSDSTDELLLTIPASDLDIVLGKYLAAAAIYSVSLLFSQLTNFLVLVSLALGDVDLGLFISTYIGYWLIGLAMLALGMAASFLTSNLTVSFVLGAMFNAPLVCLTLADRFIAGRGLAQDLAWWSFAERFGEFGRGVISASGIIFFLLVVVFGIYLSLILIGRRHWLGGRDGQSLLGHYLVRGIALALIVFGASRFLAQYDRLRIDATQGNVSSLSADTKSLIRNLDSEHTVLIEAFISKTVPEQYVKSKVDLINMLQAFDTWGGNQLKVRIYDDLEPFSEDAARAEQQYGIESQTVTTQSRGGIRQEDLFLGAAFSSGLERVVVPFFDRGIPVEYELVRSISTVTKAKRKRIGIVRTDAQLFGGFDMQMMRPRPKQLIVEELEKQYEVEEVDATSPIEEGAYDCLVAVQPSSLTQPQLDNLIAAIRNGQPTAIFEDPMPYTFGTTPGTSEPRRPAGGGGMMGMMGGGQRPPEPKGDYRALWTMLGIDMEGQAGGFGGQSDSAVIWQAFNPYEQQVKVANITPEWVFVSPDAPGAETDAFNPEEDVAAGLRQVLLLYPGAIKEIGARDLEYTPIVQTGDETGTIAYAELRGGMGGMNDPRSLRSSRVMTEKRYVTAMRIKGFLKEDLNMAAADAADDATAATTPAAGATEDEIELTEAAEDADSETSGSSEEDSESGEDAESAAADEQRNREIHVVVVSDIDLLSSEFVAIRAQPVEGVNWQFDNVTLVLNILDSLAGDESLIGIRKRQTRHSTLKMVEKATEDARHQAQTAIEDFDKEFEQARDEASARLEKANEELKKRVDDLKKTQEESGNIDMAELQAAAQKLGLKQQVTKRRMDTETARLERERDRKLEQIDHDLEAEVGKVQTRYKMYAALLPPIPPLVVGMIVWMIRRSRERKEIATTRRR